MKHIINFISTFILVHLLLVAIITALTLVGMFITWELPTMEGMHTVDLMEFFRIVELIALVTSGIFTQFFRDEEKYFYQYVFNCESIF